MSETVDAIVFGAHPDDAEMGMGGTMVKLVKAGYKVLTVSLTNSELSTYGDVESRKKEFAEAAEIIGTKHLALDFVDGQVENNYESRLKVARVIREFRPKIVFAPYHTNNLADLGGRSNVDHYTTGSLVRDSIKLARLAKAIPDLERHEIQKSFFYLEPRDKWANIIVDVSDEIQQAMQAIRAYKSQMEIKLAGQKIEDILLTWRRAVGLSIGVQYAESFVSDMELNFKPEHFFSS